MRIAHINNIAGIGSSLAQYQSEKGHNVEVLAFNKEISNRFGGTFIPFSKWNIRTWFSIPDPVLLKKLNTTEIWHYHYPYGRLKRIIERTLGSRAKKSVYLKHYHGSDLRGRRDDDFCLVASPDLLEYAPNGVWLPNPIDFSEIDSIIRLPRKQRKSSDRLRVAHYPYYRAYKEIDHHSEVLFDLEKEGKIEVNLIHNVTHTQALQIIYSADIILGKILSQAGWFGRTELEGLALGKPVMAYVSDELNQRYHPPIIRTTKESLRADLEELIANEGKRDQFGKQGAIYSRKIHSLDKIAPLLEKYYHTAQNYLDCQDESYPVSAEQL